MTTICQLGLVLLSLGCSGSDAPAAQEAGKAEAAAAPVAKPVIVEAKNDPAMKAMTSFIEKQKIDTSIRQWKTQLPRPPQVEFDAANNYFWVIESNKGTMKIRFMPDHAPMHVSSTIFLTQVGFYNDLKFHRVIPGFMAQGGCPLGRGHGNPGYSYGGEHDPKIKHDRPGLLSMANTGRPESDGSQFFLTFVPTPHLNGKHTIFGEIVEGMEVLRELERFGTGSGTTKEPLLMKNATIVVEKKPAEKAG